MTTERVLRAPQTGIFLSRHDIGDHVKAGDVVATVEANGVSKEIRTVISGVIRGLLRSGTPVTDRIKVGDVDPRDNTACHHVSDKAFAIGGGILEAILGRFNRPLLHPQGHPPLPCGQERAHSVNNATSEPFHTRRTGEAAWQSDNPNNGWMPKPK